VLTRLRLFDIVVGMPFDLMHCVYENVVPFVTGMWAGSTAVRDDAGDAAAWVLSKDQRAAVRAELARSPIPSFVDRGARSPFHVAGLLKGTCAAACAM